MRKSRLPGARLRVSLASAALLLVGLSQGAYAQTTGGNQGLAGQNQGTNSQGNGNNFSNVPGNECVNGDHTHNPHCEAPEVPWSVAFPITGAATLIGAHLLLTRSRRRLDGSLVRADC